MYSRKICQAVDYLLSLNGYLKGYHRPYHLHAVAYLIERSSFVLILTQFRQYRT